LTSRPFHFDALSWVPVKVTGLARVLADYDENRIPADRKIQVHRLAVVTAL